MVTVASFQSAERARQALLFTRAASSWSNGCFSPNLRTRGQPKMGSSRVCCGPFVLIGAMNPCPCGYRCSCMSSQKTCDAKAAGPWRRAVGRAGRGQRPHAELSFAAGGGLWFSDLPFQACSMFRSLFAPRAECSGLEMTSSKRAGAQSSSVPRRDGGSMAVLSLKEIAVRSAP